MLKIKFKASSITNLTDARYFAAWGAEWLGFNLDVGNENYASPHKVAAIKEWVDGVKIVGEFNMQTAAEIGAAVEMLNLEVVQVGMFTNLEDLKKIEGISIIQELIVEASTSEAEILDKITSITPYINYLLLNFDKNNIQWEDLKTGKSISIDCLKTICEKHKTILSINLKEDFLEELIATIQPFALNVLGGEEEKVGIKSFDELDEIFELLED